MAVNRWTDEMLDRLADAVSELRASVSELQTSVAGLVQAFIQEHEENRQYRRQMEEWKRENDLRFNILLEEIRATNQRIQRLEDAQNGSAPE